MDVRDRIIDVLKYRPSFIEVNSKRLIYDSEYDNWLVYEVGSKFLDFYYRGSNLDEAITELIK